MAISAGLDCSTQNTRIVVCDSDTGAVLRESRAPHPGLAAGSAPTPALVAEFVVAGLAVLLVAPAFALLYSLQQRRMLTADHNNAELRLAAELEPPVPGQLATAPATVTTRMSLTTRMTTALVLAVLTVRAIRDVFWPPRRR